MSKIDLKIGKYKPVVQTNLIKNEYFLEAVKYAFEQSGAVINPKYANYDEIRDWPCIGCDNGKIQFIGTTTREMIDLDELFNHVDFAWPEWATGFGYLPFADAPLPVSHRQSLVFYNENVYAYADGKYKEDVGPFAFSKFSNARRDTLQHIATRIIVNVQQPLPEVGKVYSVSYNSDTSEYFDAKILSNIDGSIVGRWLDGPCIGQLFDYTANGLEHKFKPVVSQEEKAFIKRASEILFNSDKKNSLAGLSKDLYDSGCRFVKKEE